jgi:hypothetical protein
VHAKDTNSTSPLFARGVPPPLRLVVSAGRPLRANPRDPMTPEGQWVFMATGRSPTNIAVVKYWGKRDEAIILPVNDSISVTLDPGHLSATTTVAVSPSFPSDRMWLNGKVSTNSVSLTNLHSRRLLGLFNDSRERESYRRCSIFSP